MSFGRDREIQDGRPTEAPFTNHVVILTSPSLRFSKEGSKFGRPVPPCFIAVAVMLFGTPEKPRLNELFFDQAVVTVVQQMLYIVSISSYVQCWT